MRLQDPRARVVSLDPSIQNLVEGLATKLDMGRVLNAPAGVCDRASFYENKWTEERRRSSILAQVAQQLRARVSELEGGAR